LRLVRALAHFWWLRGYVPEGRERATIALACDHGVAPEVRARTLREAAYLALLQTDFEAANALSEESLHICRALGDTGAAAHSLNGLGAVAYGRGDYRAARTHYVEALTLTRESGATMLMADALGGLSRSSIMLGDYGAARQLSEERLKISRDLGDLQRIAASLHDLALIALEREDTSAAYSFLRESLMIQRDLGHMGGIARSLESLANLCAYLSKPESAANLWGAAEALRLAIGTPVFPAYRARMDRQAAAARAAMADDAAFDRAWHDGRAMTIDQAIALALESDSAGTGTECPRSRPDPLRA
jgi:tetratricopeptide (TPR) repeat protein